MLTAAFITFVAWSTFVRAAAIHIGRRPTTGQRVAEIAGILGLSVGLPALLVGGFGLPHGWSYPWFGVVARVGYVGLTMIATAAAAWVSIDTASVWSRRRDVFPFAYRSDQ